MLPGDEPGAGLFLSPIPVPHGDPAALSGAATTYTSAHGEIDRSRTSLASAVSQASGTQWTGAGAAACVSAADRLAAAYAVTASALARGTTALRAYADSLAAAQRMAHRANDAVAAVNATARMLLTAQTAAQQAQDSAAEACQAAAVADAQAAASPHSPPARLGAENARTAASDAGSAASHAVARMNALSAQYETERSEALILCAQGTEQASQADTQAVAALDGAAAELTGPSPRPARPGASGLPGHAGHGPGFWSGLLHGAEHLGEDSVNAMASLGNAMVHDPGGVFSMIGGIGLAGVSAGGEVVGTVLDATGVGAVAGVPLNAVSAAGIAGGVTLAGAGAASVTRDALGQDRVTLMQSGDGAAGSGGDELPQTAHGAERAADPSRLSPSAQSDVVANPTQTYTQGDGEAQVYVQQVGDRFNVVVMGSRGVVSNLKNISQSSLSRLARNYNWTPN